MLLKVFQIIFSSDMVTCGNLLLPLYFPSSDHFAKDLEPKLPIESWDKSDPEMCGDPQKK